MLTIPGGQRVAATLVAGVLCLFLAGGVAAVPWADDRAAATQAAVDVVPDRTFAGAPPDRAQGRSDHGRIEGGVEHPSMAQQVATPTDSLQGQLSGVVFVLAVLVVIGAAAWGARTTVIDRFAPTGRWRGDPPEGANVGPTEDRSLTDEERIIVLLEENGGRLKQGDVVEGTEWSKAKVSRLLSSMEDDGVIVRIQLGREKLIFLSGHEPSGVRSTLGDNH